MKVLISANTSWYLYNFRASTIRRLITEGHQVVCLAPPDAHSPRLESELGARHVPLLLNGESTSIPKEIRSLVLIWRVLRREKPEMVFNFTVKLNIYCGLFCSLQGVPFANNISGLGTAFIHDSWLFRRVRWLYGAVNRRARHLFFQNEEDLAVFQDRRLLGNTPHTLLPGSGIDLERFSRTPLPADEPVTFIMIARLLGDKGVREYAEACELLTMKGVPARCLLLGPLGASNRTAIRAEEVEHWQENGVLEYLGSADDVRPMIARSHVLVLPSYREGKPRAVLEAASMGRPAIVTDVPGCRQAIIPELTGWFCEVRNAASLAEQMECVVAMSADARQRAGNAAREYMEEKFSEQRVIDAYLSCLADFGSADRQRSQ